MDVNNVQSMNTEILAPDPNEDFLSLCKNAYPNTEVIINGNLPQIRGPLQFVNIMVWELTDNCADQEAHRVQITYNPGILIIEDDVTHGNPQAILANINSENPQTHTDDIERGFGITRMRELLKKRNGSLIYKETDGRIIACASWYTEYNRFTDAERQ